MDQTVRRSLHGRPPPPRWRGGPRGLGIAPLPHPAADRGHRAPRRARTCCRPSSSSSPGPPATTPCASACADGMRLTDHRRAPGHPPDRRGPHRGPRPTTTCRCSATPSGWRASRPAWPPTTPGWSRPSARRWRPASRPACSRWSSPPRPCRSGINMPARTVVIERFDQVRRGRAGHPHLGGVRPADRAGRPARARRRGTRRRALVARRDLRRGGPGGPGPAAGPALVVPTDLQPGRQPGPAVRPRRRRWPGAAALVRRVAGRGPPPPGGGPGRGAGRAPGPAAGRPRGAGLRGRLARPPTGAGGWPASTTSPTCWWPRPWRARRSTGPSPRCWPGCSPPSSSSGGGPAGCSATAPTRAGAGRPAGKRRRAGTGWGSGAGPTLAERWPSWPRHADEVGPSRRSTWCPGPASPSPGWPGRWRAWARGAPFGTVLEVAARSTWARWPRGTSCAPCAGGRPGRPGGPGGPGPGHRERPAEAAAERLLRDVVAAGSPVAASATGDGAQP